MPQDEKLTPKQVYDRARYQQIKAQRARMKRPDPIEVLDEATIAYIAGLTDADGSIYVTHTNRLRTYYPVVSWAMTHRPTVDWLAITLASTKVQLNNHTTLRRGVTSWGASNFREQWRTSAAGSRAQLLCSRMLPYMHTKAPQASLVIAFPVDARTAPGVTLRDEIRAQRERLAEQISALNHA